MNFILYTITLRKEKISFWLKLLTVSVSLSGLILSFFSAQADGYSHWSKRLMYFTSQSNVWIILIFTAILIFEAVSKNKQANTENLLYLLKFVFTVSITLTAIVFCALLAPFSHRNGYNAWTASSIMTHVITPTLAVFDLFYGKAPMQIKKHHALYSAIPPLLYLVFTSILCILKVDFGRGDPYPYFFMNYYSPAGVFGFSDVMPFAIGSFYWMLLILGIVLSVSFCYACLLNKRIKETDA